MPQSQTLNGSGLSTSKSCTCFRRNKLQSFRASYSTWRHQTILGTSLAFCVSVLPITYQKAGHVMSIDYKEALPLFPAPLTKILRCASAGDKWQQLLTPEEFLSWMAAMWRSLLTLAKQYVLDMAHSSDASSRRGVVPSLYVWLKWNSTFLLLVTCWERAILTCQDKKNVTFTIVTLQDAIGRVGSAVWTWKCGTETLRADVGA